MSRSAVEVFNVEPDEADLRLDRWFKRRFPGLGHGRLQKFLRTGQVRVDGRRAAAGARLVPGQAVRVPPVELDDTPRPVRTNDDLSPADRRFAQSLVLFEDDALIVLNKPAGFAVQGGTGTSRHVDRLLPALATDGERPRLVHRLDRDTSGLLVVARTQASAAFLTKAFRGRDPKKLYWALVVGRPRGNEGSIDVALAKLPGLHGEQMFADEEYGKRAQTRWEVLAAASKVAAWLALEPLTGRTHQLRVHCAQALGTPILGDLKYGGQKAKLTGAPAGLMLHARALELPHPGGGSRRFEAPPPAHMAEALGWLGLTG